MGEARWRGGRSERESAALKRQREALRERDGEHGSGDADVLRAGIRPFLERMAPGEWSRRRKNIIDLLNMASHGTRLEIAKPIRVQSDEIGWYIFLAQQAIENPTCLDVSQAARNLPYIAALGDRWGFRYRVKGLEDKLSEILKNHKANPDGLLFEVLVALSYAAKGWDVELLETTPPAKSPDMLIRKGCREFYVECKRQSRRSQYSERERNEFLRRWDVAKDVLLDQKQWVWFRCDMHVEVHTLPDRFLKEIFEQALPFGNRETVIFDGVEATISARKIDRRKVRRHFKKFRVKLNSPTLNTLLGGDWAPPEAEVTTAMWADTSGVEGCESIQLGRYVENISWACGITRTFDSDVSIDKKSRDVKNLLADAVKQVPKERPSIIHIAVETLEGNDAERRRTAKLMESIPSFITDKPVAAVRIHRLRPNVPTDTLWEFDETVERFQPEWADVSDLPEVVILRLGTKIRNGTHWDEAQP